MNKSTNFKGMERRRFVRIPSWFITRYRVYPHNVKSHEDFRQGTGRNISTGGICFESKDCFDKDAILEIEIDMPALEHSVRIIGKLAWIRKKDGSDAHICGVAFEDIKKEDLKAVNKIISTFA